MIRVIEEGYFPGDWLCPACQKGKLVRNEKTFVKKETERSLAAHSCDAWEIDWLDGRIFGTLICSSLKCKEEVSFCGEWFEEEEPDPDDHFGLITKTYYRPRFFHPAINVFPLSDKIPKEIKAEIISSFALYWCDLQGCANRARSTLELILNHLKVPKRERVKTKKFSSHSLHQRIILLRERAPDIADYMLAIKWIGNSGSHGDKITAEDIRSGYEFLAKILEEIFDQKTKKLMKKAKKINKIKKPMSHLKKRK